MRTCLMLRFLPVFVRIWTHNQLSPMRQAERIAGARRIALDAYDEAVRRKDTRKQAERWPAVFKATNDALRGGL